MPTYEYACQSCGTHVEVYQRFSEAALTECGLCGGPLRKVFHPAGILFKGSGFYVTDSRAGASKMKDSEGKGADRATPEKKDAPAKVGSARDGASKGDSGGSAGDGGSSGAGSKGEKTSSPAAKERSA
jgi:putative FmdB family regulatory protein